MSNTPGQDPQRTIDAQALQDQLIEFLLETALRQKRFQNLIGLMEQVTAAARAKQGDDWKAALEQLRKELARAPLQEITAHIAASEARLVKELNQTRALVAAAGSTSSAAELRDIKAQLSRLENQVAALAGRPPVPRTAADFDRDSSNESDRRRQRAGDSWTGLLRSPVITLVSLVVAAVAVAALVFGPGAPKPAPEGATEPPTQTEPPSAQTSAPGTDSAEVPPAVAPATSASAAPASSAAASASGTAPGWQLAWGIALVQPAICPTDDAKKHVAFAHCVCPNAASGASIAPNGAAGSPVQGLAAKCTLDEKDPHLNPRLAVAAVQAVLMSAGRVESKVDGKAPGPADGELGEHTINAVKALGTCTSIMQAEGHSLSVLENKASAPEEQRTAALRLLTYLKTDPSCLSPSGATHPIHPGSRPQ